MASEWYAVLAFGLLACASNTGTSGETHFLCGDTDECKTHGSNLVCVQGECVNENSSGAGGNGGGAGDAKSLTGVWDVAGSTVGYPPTSMVVTVSPTGLEIDSEGGFLRAARVGDQWTVATRYPIRTSVFTPDRIPVDRNFLADRSAPADGDLGIVPLPLLGDWMLGPAGRPACTGSFLKDSISGSCGPTGFGPRWAPNLADGSLTGARTETRPSVFMDLGGKWTFTSTQGVACTITVDGATIQGSCGNQSRLAGSFTIQVDQDVVHGSTSNGVEFTAQRR